MVGLFSSPPTVSGIIVLSGSNNFDLLSSDFPVASSLKLIGVTSPSNQGLFLTSEGNSLELALELSAQAAFVGIPPIESSFLANEGNTLELALELSAQAAFVGIPSIESSFLSISLDPVSDTNFQSSPPTTSGIVVIEIFPGAGVGFIPPILLNERLFPIFQGVNFSRDFPEENKRIFPVLPQFSILTPGD